MTHRRKPAEWFVKDDAGVRGPISEQEMRRIVSQSSDLRLKVKQGQSRWRSAAVIRKKIQELEEHGIYICCNGIAEGPFTMTKAHELLHTVSLDDIEVRTGKEGQWVSANSWLRTLERLRRQRKAERGADQVKPTAAADAGGELELAPDDNAPSQTKASQTKANDEPVVVQAIVIEER